MYNNDVLKRGQILCIKGGHIIMTKALLEKIEGTAYRAQLEKMKKIRKQLKDCGLDDAARGVYARITGYIDAMRDCGIITESERNSLFFNYAM